MPDEGNMPRTLQEHQNLYDAIRHQDSEAAEQAGGLDHNRQLNTTVEGYNMSNSYIAIDWGSTNLRAWLYVNGELAASTRSEARVTRFGGRRAGVP